MDKKMTLEHVASDFRAYAADGGASLSQGDLLLIADAIDAELKARGEAVAWCCPDDPHNSTAFSWPGTARVLSRHTMPLYGAPPAPKIDDAMVERALTAIWRPPFDQTTRKLMRAALEAALKETP